jgi:hypothetical protein
MITPNIYDRADGTGVNAVIAGSTPGSAVSVQYQDTADQSLNWIEGASGSGDGLYVITVGNGVGQITLARAYYVRVAETVGVNPPTYTTPVYVHPTAGYDSLAFRLLMAAKAKAIRLNLPIIGGNVHHCLDVQGFYGAAPRQPALILFPNTEEWSPVSDNMQTLYDLVTELIITDSEDNDWVGGLDWWLKVRETLALAFHRKPVNPDASAAGAPQDTFGGRRWRVRFGPVAPIVRERFPYRYQGLTLLADSEF